MIEKECLIAKDNELIEANRTIVSSIAKLKAARVNNLTKRRSIAKQIKALDWAEYNK